MTAGNLIKRLSDLLVDFKPVIASLPTKKNKVEKALAEFINKNSGKCILFFDQTPAFVGYANDNKQYYDFIINVLVAEDTLGVSDASASDDTIERISKVIATERGLLNIVGYDCITIGDRKVNRTIKVACTGTISGFMQK